MLCCPPPRPPATAGGTPRRRTCASSQVVDGQVVREGETVVVADTAPSPAPDDRDADVHYQVLCRRHPVQRRLGPDPGGPGPLALS